MAPPDDPRSKTMRHLRAIMAAATAVGVAAVTTRSASGSADGGNPPSNVDSGTNPAVVRIDTSCPDYMEKQPDGTCTGYAVVDPLPPPARGGCHKDPSPGVAKK